MKNKEISFQVEKEVLAKNIEQQIKLRRFFLPGLFVLLVILFILGRETNSLPLISLGIGFIAISSLLFFSAAIFIRRTNKLSLGQAQQVLSGVFILEILTIWLTFYLFAPLASAYNIPLPNLAILFYIFYVILVAPSFRENNTYQSFFYALIWIALALLIFLNNNCQFLFEYGPPGHCSVRPMMEGFLMVISGVAVFMVQFVVNHFNDQSKWLTDRLRQISQALQGKLKEEGYQAIRLKQDHNVYAAKMAQRLREKDQQIKDLTEKLKGRFESEKDDQNQEVSEMKKTTEALLNILEDTEEARHKAEKERERTLTTINNFVDALIVVDNDGFIQMVNARAREIFKLDHDIQGKSLVELAEHPQLKKVMAQVLENQKLKTVKREGFELKEGVFFEVSTVPLPGAEEIVGYLIVLHDVSREKLVQRMKTEFVSIAAHQLRTPLSAIKWSLRMLLDGDEGELTEKQKELMEKTYFSNQRMINLVNDLLNVSRIEEGRFLYELEDVSLKETIRSIIDSVEPAVARKKLEIIFQGEQRTFPNIKADREKITLAIQNIIDNAVKYSPEKGRIVISLEEDDGFLLVSIKDSGIGIPRSQQARVFQRFFRAGNAISQETEGTGLGLFISRNIIEAHKGRIWFESQEGKGTTFYFTIPY